MFIMAINSLYICSVVLVETKKNVISNLAYMILKLILLLLVVITSVERVFSAMSLVRNK
jgi:hypothetical protein